jgi:hypothetical protein
MYTCTPFHIPPFTHHTFTTCTFLVNLSRICYFTIPVVTQPIQMNAVNTDYFFHAKSCVKCVLASHIVYLVTERCEEVGCHNLLETWAENCATNLLIVSIIFGLFFRRSDKIINIPHCVLLDFSFASTDRTAHNFWRFSFSGMLCYVKKIDFGVPNCPPFSGMLRRVYWPLVTRCFETT